MPTNGVNHDNWWMLTGNRDSIYKFVFEELRVDKYSEEPISPDFVHTSRFVLIDKEHVVRGWYNGLDSVSLSKTIEGYRFADAGKRQETKKHRLCQILDLSWLWLIIVVCVIFFVCICVGGERSMDSKFLHSLFDIEQQVTL
jgi:protein SCO1/2